MLVKKKSGEFSFTVSTEDLVQELHKIQGVCISLFLLKFTFPHCILRLSVFVNTNIHHFCVIHMSSITFFIANVSVSRLIDFRQISKNVILVVHSRRHCIVQTLQTEKKKYLAWKLTSMSCMRNWLRVRGRWVLNFKELKPSSSRGHEFQESWSTLN